jgi:hypothetical protein
MNIPELPAFRITRDDGTSYITSMAVGVTLKEVKQYFGSIQVDEDPFTGKEIFRKIISIEQVK